MIHTSLKKTLITLAISFIFVISGCAKQEQYELLPMPLVIAVAPMNQPVYDAQLLAGYIPSGQSAIDSGALGQYNALFKEKLNKTKRKYIFLTNKDLQVSVQTDSKGRSNVLSTWAQLAQKVGADFILVPQVLDFEERVGDTTNVRRPARLIMDFYLIRAKHPETDSPDGFLQTRSHYKEQSSIVSNINSDRDYVSSRQKEPVITFANEAMNRAIRDFHL